MRVISGKFHSENHYGQLFFRKKKKKFRPTSQNGRFPILRPNLRPLSGIEKFFSPNITYSYSFLRWNLPGITMSLKSLNNYFGITSKSRKNDEKFVFFDFCLWFRNNDGIIATLRLSPVYSTPKNPMINFFFQKKKNPSDIPKWSFSDFKTEPETPFGNRKFFFWKFNLLV